MKLLAVSRETFKAELKMYLFDLDGTIVDSSQAILDSYQASMKGVLGYQLDPDEEHVHELLKRRPSEYFHQHYPPNAEALAAAYARNYVADSVRAYAGMVELISTLFEHGPVGVVSNKGRARIRLDLENVGLKIEDFAVIVGAEDTRERKPHPAPILKALEAVPGDAFRGFYIGDGPHDVRAANGANMISVGVHWGYYPISDIQAAEPDHVAETVGKLKLILLGET